jgi:heat shock protein HslJ
MGSRLASRALLACLLVGALALPVDADASRTKAKKKRALTPPATILTQPTPTDAPAITLSGTFALTRIGARPVRDPDLQASRLTFLPGFRVTGTTACNGFEGRLHTDRAKRKIVGFDDVIATEMGCPGPKGQAEATTLRLLDQTANIARAGSTITLFNAVGLTLAQFSAVDQNATRLATQQLPTPEANAPQRGAPPPTRAYFGDFVLSELGGQPVSLRPTANAIPQPVAPPNTRFLTILPTLYMREGGQATGLSGCNQYRTILSNTQDQPPRFGPVVSTTKRCLDRPTERAEREIVGALRQAARVDINQNRVNLLAADGTRLARFSSATGGAGRDASLFGTKWVLRSINGVIVSATNPPTMTFEGNQASGSTGCNRFNIAHNRRAGRSSFQNGAITKMACLDQGRSQLEQRFMESLTRVSILNVTSSQLNMRNNDGSTTLLFEAD